MKVSYDKEADAAYIQLSSKRSQGGVELDEQAILHTTESDEVVGIEILRASERFPVRTLFSYDLVEARTSAAER
jgi:uncharacterized protein YuzE